MDVNKTLGKDKRSDGSAKKTTGQGKPREDDGRGPRFRLHGQGRTFQGGVMVEKNQNKEE